MEIDEKSITYIEEAVYERIAAGVTHCQPVRAEPYYVDIAISARQIKHHHYFSKIGIKDPKILMTSPNRFIIVE